MQDLQLLHDGLALMGVGMGFVFVFLTVLVLTTTLMSLVIRRLAPTPPAVQPAVGQGMAPAADRDDDAELMAVISTAVHRYRHRRPRH
ncbi:OadG family transporter subunit [Halomonas sp. BC04]|uniref:OadG family transporter subunit n=1 Tax=Halomonas sp. BC04 TaxID=1403540 RepID=UPI0003ED7D38|nr:OadG family transporter subunit [Halomonas sp. BC04]EWG99601.1 oxaloacetate decarboxylase [Halomonas sp. BC04]